MSSSSRRLFIGAIPSDFDPQSDLALGPWCFSGSPAPLPDWHHLDFPAPFADAAEFHRAGEDMAAFCQHRIRAMMPSLDALAGQPHSFPFWLILVTPWLFRLGEVAYARYAYVRAFVQQYRHLDLVADIPAGEPDWAFADMNDFSFRGLMHPHFHHWLNGRLLVLLAPAHWTLREVDFTVAAERRIRVQAQPRFKAVRQLGRKLMPRIRFDNVWGIGPVGRAALSLLLDLLPARRPGPPAWTDLPEPTHALPADFVGLMDMLMARTRPGHLSGDFHRYWSELARRRCRPGRLQVGAVTWVNERDLFTAAHALEGGEKVVSTQYGCHYGTALVFSFPALLQYRLFAFLTWGWREQQEYWGRFEPAPSPYLSRVADRHRQERDEIVLVGTTLHAFMARLHAGPQLHEIAHYRRFKERFLRSLGPNTRPHLTYRPHHLGDWDFEDMGFVRRIDPAIPEVGGNQFDLTGHLLGCRLLVLDNPGTTLHIALAANIPTIGFWQKDAWQLCRQAQPIYDAMAAAGMVFHSPEEAAAKIESILPDVQGWWHSEPVQAARRAFCREHARTSRWWWWDWLRLLARLSWSR